MGRGSRGFFPSVFRGPYHLVKAPSFHQDILEHNPCNYTKSCCFQGRLPIHQHILDLLHLVVQGLGIQVFFEGGWGYVEVDDVHLASTYQLGAC